MNDRLKTNDKLLTLGLLFDSLCPLCNVEIESIHPLIFHCAFGIKCLKTILSWLDINTNIDTIDMISRRK